jgi:hypothetical protein
MPTATSKPTEGVEVVLPRCPSCGRVGKIPIGHFGGKEFCSGPMGEGHKKVRMKKAAFRLVEEDV